MLPADDVTRLANEPTTRSAPGGGHALTTTGGGPVRVVLDTNIVLDWLVFGDADAATVGAAIMGGSLSWLATPRMQAELRAVLSRPLSSRWDPARELALTIDVWRWTMICAEPTPAGESLVCRDSADQVFIDLARQHSPAVLLTRDRALLALRRRAAALGVVISTAVAWRPMMEAGTFSTVVSPK